MMEDRPSKRQVPPGPMVGWKKGDDDADENDEEEDLEKDVDGAQQARDLVEIAYQMLPLPGQASDFFEGVPTLILKRLQGEAIAPVGRPGDRNLHFVLPSLAVRRLKNSRYLESAEGYLNRLGMFFLHPDIRLPAGVEDALELRSLDAELWCSILVEASAVWTCGTAHKDAEANSVFQYLGGFVLEILACIYKSRQHSAVMPRLRRLRIFPNLVGELMSLDDGVVLHVVVDKMHALENTEFGTRILHAEFSSALLQDADASKMAQLLGVQRVENESFLERHLLPALCDSTTDPESLVSMLVFLKSRLAYMSGAAATRLLETNAGRIVLLTEHGQPVPSGPELHISNLYMASAPDPALFLPAHAVQDTWPTVSSRYLKQCQDPEGWSHIWKRLQLSPFLSISRSPPHDSPELSFLLGDRESCAASEEDVIKRFDALAQMLSDSWSSYADMVRRCKQLDTGVQDKEKAETQRVSFLTRLRESCWIPGSDGKLHTPAFLLPDACRKIFGDKEVFPAVSKPLSKEFMRDIGMCAALSGPRALWRLRHFRDTRSPVSVSLMRKLYLFLHRNLSESEKAQMIDDDEALVFVPCRHHVVSGFRKGGSEVVVDLDRETEGQWCKASNCFLRDKSYLLDDVKAEVTLGMQKIAENAGYRCLAAYYCNAPDSSADAAELCQFFRDLGVKENPEHEVKQASASLPLPPLALSPSPSQNPYRSLLLLVSLHPSVLRMMRTRAGVPVCLRAQTITSAEHN